MTRRDRTVTDGTVVEAAGVTRTYGGVPVLRDVSLGVDPGVTAVVGPNGSGKSTLLGLLAGVVDPVSGEVVHADSDAARPVGYLPQRVPFREGFTARETAAFYGRLAEADPDGLLDRVGLRDAADRRVEALSGGMRRLLGIGQATAGDPPLVVLDEPASGLDPGMRDRAFAVAGDAASEDTAVVVSTHQLDLVDEYADSLVLLHRGTVAAAGGRAALLDEHGADDVRDLYRAVVGEVDGRDGAESAVHVTGVSAE